MSSVSVRNRGVGLSNSGQNAYAISVSTLEEKQATLIRCGKSNSSVLSQSQRLVHTASVASKNFSNMELKFVLGGITACATTSDSKSKKSYNTETSSVVAVKNAIDEPEFDAVHAIKIPENDDYLKYKPAPKSKRKVLLTPLKDNKLSLPPASPCNVIAPFKGLSECENHTIEECMKMILKLLESVDGITQLQKEVYGIIHQLYGYLIQKTANGMDILRPYGTTSANHISNDTSHTQRSDENQNIVVYSDSKNKIARTDVKSASFPISVNNTKMPCANCNMNKSLTTTDVLQTNKNSEGHRISKDELEDDDSNLLVIDEGLPVTCVSSDNNLMNYDKTAQKVENETQVHNDDNLKKDVVAFPITTSSNKDASESKGISNDIQNISTETMQMKSPIDATKFQPHLFTPDTISAIPITKCIHLYPTNEMTEVTINTLGASPTPTTPITQKEKSKKTITLSLPFDKFESFAQSKLEHNIQVSDKNKVMNDAERDAVKTEVQKNNECKTTIADIVHELPNNNSKKKCIKRKRKNNNEIITLDNEKMKSKANSNKIDTTRSLPLIVKKKRKVQVYRISKKSEEATNDKQINEKMTEPITKVMPTTTSTAISTSTNNNITPILSAPLTNKQVNEVFKLSSSIPLTASHPRTNNKNSSSTKPSHTPSPNTNPVYSPKILLNNFALQPVVKISKNIMAQHTTHDKDKSHITNEFISSGDGNDVVKRKRKHVPITYDVKNNNKRTSRYSSRISSGDLRKKLKTSCDDNNAIPARQRPIHNRDTSINRKAISERGYVYGMQQKNKSFTNIPFKSRLWFPPSSNQYRYT